MKEVAARSGGKDNSAAVLNYQIALETRNLVEINGLTGEMTVHFTEDGKEKTATKKFDAAPDLANGLILTLLKNIKPDAAETKVSFAAATPSAANAKSAAPTTRAATNAKHA